MQEGRRSVGRVLVLRLFDHFPLVSRDEVGARSCSWPLHAQLPGYQVCLGGRECEGSRWWFSRATQT